MRIGFLSWRASRLPNLATLLDARPCYLPFFPFGEWRALAGWGRKRNACAARWLAKRRKWPFLTLEDGFLRSVARDGPPLSLIVDDVGIYYCARTPSRLERLIHEPLDETQTFRVRALIEAWKKTRVSKYNHAREYAGPLPERFVLVCDQTFSDASIKFGNANSASFNFMLQAALDENPDCKVLVKTHPDVFTRKRRGYLLPENVSNHHRIQVIAQACHPVRLIQEAEVIYAVTSQMGFEALIWGKSVRCFGMPFYAGWGLTEDSVPSPDRRAPIPFEQLVYAALVKYPRYLDPVDRTPCEPERAFSHVGLQRRRRSEFPQRIVAFGFSRWKRPFVAKFLQGSDVFFDKVSKVGTPRPAAEAVAVWGAADVPPSCAGIPVLRIEDGFLRSSGLGADLVRPLSLVIDDIGIYFDATRPSRLERILESEIPDAGEVHRARNLRERIVKLDLTKYNLSQNAWTRPVSDKPVLLVVGQVETDASIRLGSPEVRSNVELLRRVRRENPSAYIVYKPHPDVLAGLRRQGNGERDALTFVDEVLARPVSLRQLLGQVDEVHTMTSLLGFEALIRGAKVVCHGLPFYAGWGLTEDRIPCPRRTRRLTVAELVHGALISYPRYFNYERDCFVEPEQAVEQLAVMANCGPRRRSLHRKILRIVIVAWRKIRGNTR